MGLLNRLFSSTESLAQELELDEQLIQKQWKTYLKTVSKKKVIIEQLSLNKDFDINLQKLTRLLTLELVDISQEEKEEAELIDDLEVLEHAQKIKRVQRLEQCLGYAETKYEYTYHLLHQLHLVLKSQMHLVKSLRTSSAAVEKLISHLQSQEQLEREIIRKIERIETFPALFSALARGEQRIRRLDVREKRLLKKMQKGISRVFSNELKKRITSEWAIAIFNAIEDKIREVEAQGKDQQGDFLGMNPDINFEFVNRPEFIELTRETIQTIRKRNCSEQLITVFVQLFREWYNDET